MSDSPAVTSESVYKDRKIGLVLFGVLQLGLGGLCALMIPLMLFGMVVSKTIPNNAAPPVDARMVIPGILFYVLIATWFIWMGIGSILARRWARALLVVSSWTWLVCGLGGIATMWLILPDMYAQMAATGQVPKAMIPIIQWVTLGFMTAFYVLLPGSMALFYSSKHVKATCEFRNPNPSWTDACPLPVLAQSLLFGLWALSLCLMGFYGWAVPFFGLFLSGAAGATVVLATAALLACAAWGTYQLKVCAWRLSVGLIAAWALSVATTFSRHSLMDFYAMMRFPQQQLDLMKPVCDSHGTFLGLFCAAWIAGLLGYLLYTRRFYPPHE